MHCKGKEKTGYYAHKNERNSNNLIRLYFTSNSICFYQKKINLSIDAILKICLNIVINDKNDL